MASTLRDSPTTSSAERMPRALSRARAMRNPALSRLWAACASMPASQARSAIFRPSSAARIASRGALGSPLAISRLMRMASSSGACEAASSAARSDPCPTGPESGSAACAGRFAAPPPVPRISLDPVPSGRGLRRFAAWTAERVRVRVGSYSPKYAVDPLSSHSTCRTGDARRTRTGPCLAGHRQTNRPARQRE